MDADFSCLEGDNKENIPPSSVKEVSPAVLQDCKLSVTTGRKLKRKFRMPLKDITNLFVVGLPVQSSSTAALPDLGLHSVPSLSEALNCRKRKALTAAEDGDIDWKHKASSKILRKGFR